MDMVKSKVFGMGKVINKEVKEKGTYICGRYLITDSFTASCIQIKNQLQREVKNLCT